MKITSMLFISALMTLNLFGQPAGETIQKANDLIAAKKYESAFKLLDSFDPDNTIPDIVLLKTDIALNYFVTSIMHQMFSFRDLESDEDIMDFRGSEGSFNAQMFQIDSILEGLIQKYPDNCNLYKGLGNFYYEVHMKYGGNWLKDENELFELIAINDQKAIDENCADYLTYYVMGYIMIVQEKYKKGIPYFLKSIELKDDDADSHYNVAYAYLFSDDKDNALKHAKKALELYTDLEYKSDAARIAGQIYYESDDDKNALTYFELAEIMNPGNYYTLGLLVNLYVKSGNEKAKEYTKTFFDLDPANPMIYNDLGNIYFENDRGKDRAGFFKEQLSVYDDQAVVLGNLNFYLGRYYLDVDKKLAKKYFLKAKEIMSKVYDKDHEVFEAINDGIRKASK
ncbi:MAG: hypothetical protein IPH04_01315 [Saprospirales bacterium]|nr:hypothetical protein [Saprospirales bacterium]